MPSDDAPLAAQMRAGAIVDGLEQRQALARIESRLFGRPSKPITLARYVLLEAFGRGSRGIVVRAYDPQLDRKVAIKLLLAQAGVDPRERALLREARAMAKVSHPNVIAVYDFGAYDEAELGLDPDAVGLEIPSRGVFVVMELIEGLDLREWLAAKVPEQDWRAIVAMFVEAGRGLAAAHDAGLVHRDFKPSNVRVGVDGRVCVLDFGLARAVAQIVPARSTGAGADDRVGLGEARTIVGTPMYMPPEQHRGAASDARGDQYSFGVALYEALTGAPPFLGSLAEIAADKRDDAWLRVPEASAVPSVIWAVLRRTVSPDPGHRFADMHGVLAALELGLARRRRRWLAIASAPVLVAGLTLWAVADRAQPVDASAVDLCSGAEARVAEVWDPEVRAAIEARLVASGADYAAATWAAVQTELDDYTRAWAGQHRDACEATRLRGEQSEAILDLRMACLDRRLHEVEIVTRTLLDADAGVVEHAVTAAHALGWLGACADLDALQSRVRLPHDPALREAIETGHTRLAEAMILDAAGRYTEALAIADEVATQAKTLEHAPLAAAASLRRAAALEGRGEFAAAEAALLDTLALAEASRDEAVAADAWLRMVWIVGVELGRGREGESWLRLAEAAVARLGEDPIRTATLIHNRAGLRLRQGRDELALADYLAARTAQISVLGDSDPAVARTSNHIANALINLGRFDEAWVYAERSRALRVETLGANHPLVAASYNNMAAIRLRQDQPEAALALAEQALAIDVIAGTRLEVVARILARDAARARGDRERVRAELTRLLELPGDRYPEFVSRDAFAAELAALDVPPPI
jgi:eukaryotic-like serine/threonine-protein kinase